MDTATPPRRAAALPAFLAGFESGMLGAAVMLASMGVLAELRGRSFWTAANLMASAFYGARAIRSGFAAPTVSGLALYVVLYSLLGAAFAAVARDRMPRLRTALAAMVFALAWYYVSFHLLWKAAMPLVALLHVESATAAGHLVYGAILGSYPRLLREREEAEPSPPSPARSSSEPDPASRSESS